MERSQCVG
jgi:hypothetical protein